MKYTKDTYENYGSFFAKALEIAKDKVGLYNQLLSPPMRKKTNSKGFAKLLETLIYILRVLGWAIYVAIAALVALGFYAYFGGMGTLIATNPLLAAVVAALGGQGIYLIWKHRDFIKSQKEVGDRYKIKFDSIRKEQVTEEKKAKMVENLLKECVISLCIEAYQINSDEANEKIGAEI